MAVNNAVFVLGLAFLIAHAKANDFANFSYSGSSGPHNWGNLSPNYQLCSRGQKQSPININKNETIYTSNLPAIGRNYSSTNATLIDNGFNIMLRFGPSIGQLFVDGKNYSLIQMHWHSPSEHTIDGERFPVEAHLVHKSDDGNISVVAILFKYGKPDPFLIQLKQKIAELAKDGCSCNQEAPLSIGYVSTRALRRSTRKYFRYVGSLTTPPCTENVLWQILGKERQISQEQVDALKAPLGVQYKHNARPIQPLNGRKVQLYDQLHGDSDHDENQ